MFAFTYLGNGRLTGRVCENDHEYHPPEEPGRVGTYEGVGAACCHNTTDGVPVADIEEANDIFERGEHMEIGHQEPSYWCPICRGLE